MLLPRADIRQEDARFAYEHFISPHMGKFQLTLLIDSLRANQGNWVRMVEWTITGQ
jgi:hypothetical protein